MFLIYHWYIPRVDIASICVIAPRRAAFRAAYSPCNWNEVCDVLSSECRLVRILLFSHLP